MGSYRLIKKTNKHVHWLCCSCWDSKELVWGKWILSLYRCICDVHIAHKDKITIYFVALAWTSTFSTVLGQLPVFSPVLLVHFSMPSIRMHKVENSRATGRWLGATPVLLSVKCNRAQWLTIIITTIMVDMKRLRKRNKWKKVRWC